MFFAIFGVRSIFATKTFLRTTHTHSLSLPEYKHPQSCYSITCGWFMNWICPLNLWAMSNTLYLRSLCRKNDDDQAMKYLQCVKEFLVSAIIPCVLISADSLIIEWWIETHTCEVCYTVEPTVTTCLGLGWGWFGRLYLKSPIFPGHPKFGSATHFIGILAQNPKSVSLNSLHKSRGDRSGASKPLYDSILLKIWYM